MAFAAMIVAALFLVGCSSNGDTGMAGPMGPAGEAPSDEKISRRSLRRRSMRPWPSSPIPTRPSRKPRSQRWTEQIADVDGRAGDDSRDSGRHEEHSSSAADLAAASAKVASELNMRFTTMIAIRAMADPDPEIDRKREPAGHFG